MNIELAGKPFCYTLAESICKYFCKQEKTSSRLSNFMHKFSLDNEEDFYLEALLTSQRRYLRCIKKDFADIFRTHMRLAIDS